jgi:hypothetical protein
MTHFHDAVLDAHALISFSYYVRVSRKKISGELEGGRPQSVGSCDIFF